MIYFNLFNRHQSALKMEFHITESLKSLQKLVESEKQSETTPAASN